MRLYSLLAACAVFGSAYADDWLPVTPEELQMRSEPKAPKVPAIYLYRQVDRDDQRSALRCPTCRWGAFSSTATTIT
jgi:hypothetical protein